MIKSYTIPSDITIEDKSDLLKWFNDDIDYFIELFNIDPEIHDSRATVDEVYITEVEVSDCSIAVTYAYNWSAYYGCRDMNLCDSDYGRIAFRRIKNEISYDYKPNKRIERNTADEL